MEKHLSESAHVCLLESGKKSCGLTLERCAVVQITSQIDDAMICFPPSTDKLVEF